MRTTLTWLGIAGAILAVYIAKTIFNFSDTQIGFVGLCIFVAVLAHQVNELRSARARLKPSVLKALFEAGPITVKHDTPRFLTPAGQETWVEEYDRACFGALWYFADHINKLYSDLSEPIRLQELSDTSIRGNLDRGTPTYGRRYDIYYNQLKVGRLQITAGLDRLDPQIPSVDAEIVLDPPTMLPYRDVYGFLQLVAELLTSAKRPHKYAVDDRTEYAYAMSEIRDKIVEHLWDAQRHENWYPDLTIKLSGTPDRYFRMAQMQLEKGQSKSAAE